MKAFRAEWLNREQDFRSSSPLRLYTFVIVFTVFNAKAPQKR